MLVTMQAAAVLLTQLIEAAQAGAEVIITDGGSPVAELVALPKKTRFKFDILKGVLTEPPPDFFEPMGEEELKHWEGGD